MDLGDTITLAANVFDSSGAPTNATGVTLTITQPDGTTTSPAVTNPPSTTGQYRYTFKPLQAGRHDVRWVFTAPDTAMLDVFDVLAADDYPLFSLAELRVLPNMNDTTKYPDATLERARLWIEGIIEQECGTTFTYRTYTELHHGTEANRRMARLLLRRRYPREIIALTENGVGWSAGQLADLVVNNGVVTRRAAGAYDAWEPFEYGYLNLEVTYRAGYTQTPPGDLKEAALQAARYRVLTGAGAGGVSDRTTTITNDLGTVQLAIAGERYPTGLPEVDAIINRYARTVGSRSAPLIG